MTTTMRIVSLVVGLLLLAQGAGKLLDFRLYLVAMERFRAFPASSISVVAAIWIIVELAAFGGLGVAAVRPGKLVFIVGASAALVDAVAYAMLTVGTKLRGIEVMNCTCFGVYLPQRLSTSVLLQDAFMLAVTAWTLRAALRFSPAP